MKKIIAAILSATLLLTCFALPAFALYDNEDESLICKDTVDASFIDNQILVYLYPYELEGYEKGMTWTADIFGENLPIESITEQNTPYKGIVYLHFTLSVHDKQVVLDTIKELEKLDFIYFAEPNHILGRLGGLYESDACREAQLASWEEVKDNWKNTPDGQFLTQWLKGDVDNDNSVTSIDALNILHYSVGKAQFTDEQLECADINVDAFVNSVDSVLALQESVA
jgi:hypothetical protein